MARGAASWVVVATLLTAAAAAPVVRPDCSERPPLVVGGPKGFLHDDRRPRVGATPRTCCRIQLLSRLVHYKDMDAFADLTLQLGSIDDYDVGNVVGGGATSQVFSGRSRRTGLKVVIKVLAPRDLAKVKREVKILEELCGVRNVIQVVDVVATNAAFENATSIIFEAVDTSSHSVLYPLLTEREIRHYAREFMLTLTASHDHGVMHRDLKPTNVLIDHGRRQLRVIDWGLSEVYVPERRYTIRAPSRSYRPPDVHLGVRRYDFAVDLWSFGCVLLEMLFPKPHRRAFFFAKDHFNTVRNIALAVGTRELRRYVEATLRGTLRTKAEATLQGIENATREGGGDVPPRPWADLVTPANRHRVSDDALDLLDKLICVDPTHRITAKAALHHPYLRAAS